MLAKAKTKRDKVPCPPPTVPYVKLLQNIKRPRRGLLTRFEFAVLSVLDESEEPLDQQGILEILQDTLPGSKPSTHTYRQLLELESMGCVHREVPAETLRGMYTITDKGRQVIRKAAMLLMVLHPAPN